jgi:hypothetical protein
MFAQCFQENSYPTKSPWNKGSLNRKETLGNAQDNPSGRLTMWENIPRLWSALQQNFPVLFNPEFPRPIRLLALFNHLLPLWQIGLLQPHLILGNFMEKLFVTSQTVMLLLLVFRLLGNGLFSLSSQPILPIPTISLRFTGTATLSVKSSLIWMKPYFSVLLEYICITLLAYRTWYWNYKSVIIYLPLQFLEKRTSLTLLWFLRV